MVGSVELIENLLCFPGRVMGQQVRSRQAEGSPLLLDRTVHGLGQALHGEPFWCDGLTEKITIIEKHGTVTLESALITVGNSDKFFALTQRCRQLTRKAHAREQIRTLDRYQHQL